MERVYCADDPIFIGYLKSLLQAEGIACTVRNELLLGASGELPPNECWPEIWVLDAADTAAAKRIVDRAVAGEPNDGQPWTCAHCGEHCEPQFKACWRCESLRR